MEEHNHSRTGAHCFWQAGALQRRIKQYPMQVSLIRDPEELAALRDAWQALLPRCAPNHVFMTWEWVSVWWKLFGRGRQLFIVTVRDRGEIVGILPLMLFVDRHGGAARTRYLHFVGFKFEGWWTDWMDIIATRKEEVVPAVLHYLKRCQHLWDAIDLWNLPEDSDTIPVLESAAQRLGFPLSKRYVDTCPYLPTVADWSSYYQARSMKSGSIERQIRRLQSKGLLKFYGDASSMGANVDTFFDSHERRQDRSAYSMGSSRNLFRHLSEVMPSHWLQIAALQLDGRLIAAQLNFRYNGKLYYIVPTFDAEFAQFSPGKVLLRYLIEECFHDDAVDEFDFLRGTEPYKYEWATAERRTVNLQIHNAYMAGWTGRAFRRMPLFLRRSVIAGRETIGSIIKP